MIKILAALLISVISIYVCSGRAANFSFFNDSIVRLDNTKETVMKFSAATLAVSVGITLLPDDYATPLANTLAEMSKYFIVILGMIFFEELMINEGIPIAFAYLIPLACLLYIAYVLSLKEIFKSLAVKLWIFAIAMILVVPCSTYFSDVVCAKYKTYINETIDIAQKGTEKIKEISLPAKDNQSYYERVSEIFQTAINGIKELFDYFSMVIEKCINAIAMLLVVSCAVPVLTFMLFVWLFKQLFQFQGTQFVADRINTIAKKLESVSSNRQESEETE